MPTSNRKTPASHVHHNWQIPTELPTVTEIPQKIASRKVRTMPAAKTATKSAAPAVAPEDQPLFVGGVTEDVIEKADRTRSRKANPLREHLESSHKSGKTLGVTVRDPKEAVNMLRRAANELNIGVTIAVTDLGDGTHRVKFAGKERRSYTPRKK